ncbi:MAG: pilus assembly protein [Thermoclostridium sp.]|nr:pilus assembly protein [Thermoclostridium sp.]
MRLLKQKKGQSLVETAIVLPLVLLLLMGIVDFGFLFNNYIVISNASREAARKGSLGGTDAEITQLIQNYTSTLDPSRLNIEIYPDQSQRFHGSEIRITLRYNNRLITPVIGSLLGEDITLQGQVIMRVE